MHIVPIAWMFVVLLMTVAEATSTQGTLLGAFFTFLLYGLLPLTIVMYLLGTPTRWRGRKAAEQQQASLDRSAAADGDGGAQPSAADIASERKEV